MRRRHDRDPDWAIRVILVASVAGVVLAIRILFGTTWPGTLPAILALGLCAAWAAQLAAALLFVLAGIERLRKAERSLVGTQWPGLVALLCAIGLALAMLGLALIGGSENAIVLGIVAAIAAVVAWMRRGSVPRTTEMTLALLIAPILAFQIPREIGVYSLRWDTAQTQQTANWSGGENCTGWDLGDRRAGIAPHQPDYVVVAHLSGSLGEMVAAELGAATPAGANTATVTVTGHLDFGGLGCRVPIHRSLHVQSNLQSHTAMALEWPDGATLQCSANHGLAITLDATTTGIASCRDLASTASTQIAQEIRRHAAAVTGH